MLSKSESATGEDQREIEEDIPEKEDKTETAKAKPNPGYQGPSSVKRRQYYFKQVADIFSKTPQNGTTFYLYSLTLTLSCPIPEEQNTRGRKIYPPENAKQVKQLNFEL